VISRPDCNQNNFELQRNTVPEDSHATAGSSAAIDYRWEQTSGQSAMRSQPDPRHGRELRGSGLSLMPEDLERDLAPQSLADLLACLRGG
jgi:hypothetical protein